MKFTDKTLAGVLIFLGALLSLMGIIVSEALYPGYHVSQVISDLGVGSTALIFNVTIFIFGILLIAAAYLLLKAGTNIWFTALMALIGIGEVCVGIFPETTRTPHMIAATIVFVCGGIIAIMSFRIFPVPWAWISGALGIITLTAFILFRWKAYLGLGMGGMERIIVYPLFLWAFGSGVFFMSSEKIVSGDLSGQ